MKRRNPRQERISSGAIENAGIAREEQIPMCQDTGFAVVFMEMGQEMRFSGVSLREAIEKGVRQG